MRLLTEMFRRFPLAATLTLSLMLAGPSVAFSQELPPEEPRQSFAGTLPTGEGEKSFPIIGAVEELPESPLLEDIEAIRQSYIEDGAIYEAPEPGKPHKPVILVIDTPSKKTPISPEYEALFEIKRIELDDGLIDAFQRHSNNFCAVLKMCFSERKKTALKFAKILAPAAGFTTALKGVLAHKTVAVATLTVHPALFAVWQTTFMMSYTYFKTRYSQGIDRLFTYTSKSITNKSVRRWIVAKSLVFNYAFDISMALLINYAMGSPNSEAAVIANALIIDSMGNIHSFVRNLTVNNTIKKYPLLATHILEGKQDIGILEKMLVTPFTLVMRNLFTLGVIPSTVSAGGSFLLYSTLSLYRLIRGPEGVMKDIEKAQGSEKLLDRVSRAGQKVWVGMMKLAFAGCVSILTPENAGMIGPAATAMDLRFVSP